MSGRVIVVGLGAVLGILNQSWAFFRRSWASEGGLREVLGHLGGILGALGGTLGHQHRFSRGLDCKNRIFKKRGKTMGKTMIFEILASPGSIFGGLGSLLGPLGVVLGRSWGLLGRSWAILGRSFGILRRSWVALGGSWALLERSWQQSWDHDITRSKKGRSGSMVVRV